MTAIMRLVFLVVALAAFSASYPQRQYRVLQPARDETRVQFAESTTEWITDTTNWETTTEVPVEPTATQAPTELPTTDAPTELPTTQAPTEIPTTTSQPDTTTTEPDTTTSQPDTTTTEPDTTAPEPTTTTTEAPPATDTTNTPEPTITTTEPAPTTTETTTTPEPTTTTPVPPTTTPEPTTTTTEPTTTTTETPTTTATPCDPSSINIYELIATLQSQIQNLGLDPFAIPDMNGLPFTFHYLLTNHQATIDLNTGWAQDLSNFLLAGPANVTCSDNQLLITLPLFFDSIKVSWSYQVTAGLFNPAGDMNVINRLVEAVAALKIDPATNSSKFLSLEIINQGIPDITYTSMGAIANAVAEPLDTLYKETIFPQFIQEIRNKILE